MGAVSTVIWLFYSATDIIPRYILQDNSVLQAPDAPGACSPDMETVSPQSVDRDRKI